MECEVRAVLLWRDGGQHSNIRRNIMSVEGPVAEGRIYPGVLPEQRGDSWDRVYPEYLWDGGHGAAYDHRQRTSL